MQLIMKGRLQTQGKQRGQKKNYLTENQPLIKATRDYLERSDHLLACFNKKRKAANPRETTGSIEKLFN